MNEHSDAAHAATQRQHEHYLKLIDVFETRQTWAFNFAILLYAGGFSVVGTLVDKLQPHNMIMGMLLVMSVALPILMLPLCFLYADVSVWCAALSQANLDCEALPENLPQYKSPSAIAFDWLEHHKLRIEEIANLRVMLFYIAPSLGIATCIVALFLWLHSLWCNSQNFAYTRVISMAAVGSLCSLVSLWATHWACHKTIKAREKAHESENRKDLHRRANTQNPPATM